MSDLNLLHIYAQQHEHDAAWIVGSKGGLTALRDAIDRAIKDGEGYTPIAHDEVMASDGEGYSVRIIQDNSDWGAPPAESETVWDLLECPYVGGGPYQESRPNVIWPWSLWDWEAEKRRRMEAAKLAKKEF